MNGCVSRRASETKNNPRRSPATAPPATPWFLLQQLRLCPLRLSEFLRHLDHDRRNRLPDFLVKNAVKQLHQANALLASVADQKMLLKLLEQLTVLMRRQQDVFQRSSIRAVLVNLLPHEGDDVSLVARQVLVHAHVVKS